MHGEYDDSFSANRPEIYKFERTKKTQASTQEGGGGTAPQTSRRQHQFFTCTDFNCFLGSHLRASVTCIPLHTGS